MIVRFISILFSALFLAGCASPKIVSQNNSALALPPPVTLPVATPSGTVETRYEIRGYREALDPALRHEAHAVFRSTRIHGNVPGSAEVVSRTTYPPASYSPLPASAELNAEIASQKEVTAAIRVLQASMIETERQMQSQYAVLVRQSAEAIKTRESLEAERRHSRSTPPAPPLTPQVPPAPTLPDTAPVKW